MGTYRCLSIRQPWVWAIFFAGKPVENRNWSTKVRGRVLIHSAQATDCEVNELVGVLPDSMVPPLAVVDLPRGCIFGSVTITDCVTDHPSPWFFGKYGFVLADPKPLAVPIPYKGKVGFFDVPASALAAPATGEG